MAPYVYQPYPRHMHRPGGQFRVVQSDAERDQAQAEGWWLTPNGPDAPPPEDAPRKRGRPRTVTRSEE
jgi:hypothetical protein